MYDGAVREISGRRCRTKRRVLLESATKIELNGGGEQVVDHEQHPEMRMWSTRDGATIGAYTRNGYVAQARFVVVVTHAQQGTCSHRTCVGQGTVVAVARAHNQRFVVVARLEKRPALAVEESREERLADLASALEPNRVARSLVEIDEAIAEVRMIFEHRGDVGAPSSCRAKQLTVALTQVGPHVPRGAKCARKVGVVSEHSRGLCHRADHQAVPRREDLVVFGWCYAPFPQIEDLGFRDAQQGLKFRERQAQVGRDFAD